MKEDLCIPIYLNEKIVFDLLAIIENGFSHIREVKTSTSNQNNMNGEMDASLKNNTILSTLFGITLSDKVNAGLNNFESKESKQEKVHTNVSLFSKLRRTLVNEKILCKDLIDNFDIQNIVTGDFIEIAGTLNRSPMIETMETVIELFNTFSKFFEEQKTGSKKNNKTPKSDNEIIFNQIKLLYDDLTKSNTLDLLVDINNKDNTKVLLSTQLDNFVTGFESELVDGRYRILGKVIKIIDKNNSINLFRKTSFKAFHETILNELIQNMNNSFRSDESGTQGMQVPEIISRIHGPAIIVIPIAIYA